MKKILLIILLSTSPCFALPTGGNPPELDGGYLPVWLPDGSSDDSSEEFEDEFDGWLNLNIFDADELAELFSVEGFVAGDGYEYKLTALNPAIDCITFDGPYSLDFEAFKRESKSEVDFVFECESALENCLIYTMRTKTQTYVFVLQRSESLRSNSAPRKNSKKRRFFL